ncbi:DapH/DapD/GlmU-related protein [Mechercharimyces sp. CAU 1602]|uniref:acyltransferase n=1 Tax=Mechercharimyces sp. CAU 1602 TaxID=2973933 RepID=UPI002162B842|nr:acyltransferase [Mechercharimyces sp. CAU 1602]MCS1352214.1 acyltransferase [Mechercharimyces sp. CAU 1602]
MRRTERYPVKNSNSLWQMYRLVPFWKVFRNVCVNLIARFTPSLRVKNSLYRTLLGMRVGDQSAVALMVMMDVLYPERITIGKNTIIGFQTTILTHEYLIDEYRIGDVVIGDHVMVGANSTILPGVTIGDHAIIGAGSLVNKDVPAHAFVAGNPIRLVRTARDK